MPVSTKTKLSLSRFAEIFGIHPLHFNQVRLASADQVLCDNMYFQWEWQNSDHVSREEIARAILEAEDKIERQLGYRLIPSWEVDEWRPSIRPFRRELVNLSGSNVRGYRQHVEANWGYFISGGIEAKILIEAGAAIVYSDSDSDGYNETATVTVATTVTDKNEIAVYYPGHDGDDAWEIRPISVVISGGNAIITFRRELVVIESKLNLFDITDAEAVGETDAHFLSTVDVYRHYNDPQTQATFLWEPLAGVCTTCTGSGCEVCAYSTQTGCLIVQGDPRRSLIGYTPATWDSDDEQFVTASWAVGRLPDIVRLYYYNGYRDKRQSYTSRLSPDWERTVAYMAAALMDRPPCDCAADIWRKQREDFALVEGDEDGKPLYRFPAGVESSSHILTNPFGTRRGEVNAWLKVRDQQVFSAVDLNA